MGSYNGTETEVSFSEFLACSELSFEWGDSYDTKDWARLTRILAPTVKINYGGVNGAKADALTIAEFVKMMSAEDFLGDPLVKTQHLLGGFKYRKIAPDTIIGYHQIRAAHQRYVSEELREVELKGHSHAEIELTYVKVNGVWKWGGITTHLRWSEYNFERVFGFQRATAAALA